MDYRPTMINLTHVINIVAKELMGTINAVSRVREALGDSTNTSSQKKPPQAAAAPTTATGAAEDGAGARQAGGEGAKGEGGSAAGETMEVLPVMQVYLVFDSGTLSLPYLNVRGIYICFLASEIP